MSNAPTITTAHGLFTPRRHWHFLRRLHERYGIHLDRSELEECLRSTAEDVRTGEAEIIKRHLDRGTCVVLLNHGEDMEIQAVFEPNDTPSLRDPGMFVTALKPGSFLRDGTKWYRSPLHSQKDEEDRLVEPYVSGSASESAMAGQLAGLMQAMSRQPSPRAEAVTCAKCKKVSAS